MEIIEVPVPQLKPGYILVQNFYSVISAGTESKTVSDARKGYIGKARSRKKEVAQVLELIRSHGVKATYDMVMNKLESPSPLGYSCAGEVIATGEGVTEFSVGDHVACGGATASHAGIVAIPKNLAVKLEHQVDLKEAAFTTIASIAMQGIRQAGVDTGGNCVVIGLGLVGILTLKLLDAAGVRGIGIDIDEGAVNRAKNKYRLSALHRSDLSLNEQILHKTRGHGADAVIITATSKSDDPVNLAGELARQKARVVVVGAVATGFDRTHYYRKELDLRMSCSYGPGRYDARYEEKGIDYPIGYARWTEQRNMQAVADMLAAGRIRFDDMITHIFSLEKSPEAYELILKKEEPFLGLLIEYTHHEEPDDLIVFDSTLPDPADVSIGVIGSGSYARNIMLPLLSKTGKLTGIATTSGINTAFIGSRYHFHFGTVSPKRLIERDYVNTVFILSRHNLHAGQAIESLQAGKHTFVEKPLCLTPGELEEIALIYSSLPQPRPHLMVGFNRRFSPAVRRMMQYLPGDMPRAIHMRINAGRIPKEHWVHDREIGGGRIIGEGCHFIDLAGYIAGSPAVSVYAQSMGPTDHPHDTVNISIRYENGSIASISYFSNGNHRIPKEEIEVFSGSQAAKIHDFRKLTLSSFRGRKEIKFSKTDKGHGAEVESFIRSIKEGSACPIPFSEIVNSMRTTFRVDQSLREGRPIML